MICLQLYGGMSKERRRIDIAKCTYLPYRLRYKLRSKREVLLSAAYTLISSRPTAIRDEIVSVPPGRLLALLGQALKWQQQQGLLPPGQSFDLFRGSSVVAVEEDQAPKREDKKILFGKKSHAECGRFSPDGVQLLSAIVEGAHSAHFRYHVCHGVSGWLRRGLGHHYGQNQHRTALSGASSPSPCLCSRRRSVACTHSDP